MNYLVMESGSNQKYNATSKAREDVNNILLSSGFKRLDVNTSYKRFNNKILKLLQIPYMIHNKFKWIKKIKKINNSNILIQYPALNSVMDFDKIIRKASVKNNVILLIHDLDSLRGNKKNIIRQEDKKNLCAASTIICHNDSMKNEIIKMGIDSNKIIVLEIFDYLYDNIEFKNRKKNNEVIIAGNLSPQKVKYIEYINKINNIVFNLYGVGYEETNSNNICYKGKYSPVELLNNLDGSFGLIWDGDSIEGCFGNMGNYLRYNNPHKLSLYMAAGIPVIAWKNAAISKFIKENNVGILVDKLDDINNSINNITNDEYKKMVKNCMKISKRLKDGFYTKKAIDLAVNKKGEKK